MGNQSVTETVQSMRTDARCLRSAAVHVPMSSRAACADTLQRRDDWSAPDLRRAGNCLWEATTAFDAGPVPQALLAPWHASNVAVVVQQDRESRGRRGRSEPTHDDGQVGAIGDAHPVATVAENRDNRVIDG